jgi:hypothetical protein
MSEPGLLGGGDPGKLKGETTGETRGASRPGQRQAGHPTTDCQPVVVRRPAPDSVGTGESLTDL